MTRPLVAIGLFALVSAACGGHPTSPDASFPVTLTLQPGQMSSAGDLAVTFLGVSSDSRCPAAAICISSGEATLQFAFYANSRSTNNTLQLYDADKRRINYEGFQVEVQTLAPYPITFNSIRAEDYRVTVRIDR
jgi:hypothetical protein